MLIGSLNMRKLCGVFLSVIAFIIVSATLIPTSASAATLPAGAGEWDYVGTSTFKHESVTVPSGGGDFKAHLESGQSWTGYVQLFVYYNNSPDVNIGDPIYLSSSHDAVWRGVKIFRDDPTYKVYIKKAGNSSDNTTTISVDFYD
ncbi:MAG: hypothetical protein ACE3JK_17920 [Sporolactobacillus sp.]